MRFQTYRNYQFFKNSLGRLGYQIPNHSQGLVQPVIGNEWLLWLIVENVFLLPDEKGRAGAPQQKASTQVSGYFYSGADPLNLQRGSQKKFSLKLIYNLTKICAYSP